MSNMTQTRIYRYSVTCTKGHDGTSMPEGKREPVTYLTDDFGQLGCGLVGCKEPMGTIYRDTHDAKGRRIAREAVA